MNAASVVKWGLAATVMLSLGIGWRRGKIELDRGVRLQCGMSGCEPVGITGRIRHSLNPLDTPVQPTG